MSYKNLGVGVLGVMGVNAARIIWGSRRRGRQRNIEHTIVLGMAQYDGRPGDFFQGRIAHAIDRGRENPGMQIWVVGGKLDGDRWTEAEVGRREICAGGIEQTRVHTSAWGNDTLGSLEYLLKHHPELKEHPIGIITDPLHCARARLLARECGLDPLMDPTPYSPAHPLSSRWWIFLWHEIGGLVVADCARLCGREVADQWERVLRALDAFIKPQRRIRHAQLKAAKEHPDED